jgi:hypothetical protein
MRIVIEHDHPSSDERVIDEAVGEGEHAPLKFPPMLRTRAFISVRTLPNGSRPSAGPPVAAAA